MRRLEIPILELRTPRLWMRPLLEDDRGLYCELYGDADTMRFIGPPLTSSLALARFDKALSLAHAPSSSRRFMAVASVGHGAAFGLASLQQLDGDASRVEAGLMFRAAARAQGHASEALAALVEHALHNLPISEVRVRARIEHTIARRLVVGVGFERCDDGSGDQTPGRVQFWRIRR